MSQYLITCIVEKGKADKVADAAILAGAQGATILGARGKGVREKLIALQQFIQIEKEVILIVVQEEQKQAIFDAVALAAQLKIPGRGFAYVQAVEQASGFFKLK